MRNRIQWLRRIIHQLILDVLTRELKKIYKGMNKWYEFANVMVAILDPFMILRFVQIQLTFCSALRPLDQSNW